MDKEAFFHGSRDMSLGVVNRDFGIVDKSVVQVVDVLDLLGVSSLP